MGYEQSWCHQVLFNDLNEVGIRVAVRNSQVEIMVALWLLSEKIPKPSSVVMLELLVARRAALFVQELGFHESIFEGDSEICINALQSGMPHQLPIIIW